MDRLWLANLEKELSLLVGGCDELHPHRIRLDAHTLARHYHLADGQPDNRGRATHDGLPATLAPPEQAALRPISFETCPVGPREAYGLS